MAYSKLPKGCQDYPLGFQDVNQAIDNNAALRDLYDVRHGTGEPGAGISNSSPWSLAGRHDDVHVSRTVARVEVSTSNSIVAGTLRVTGPAVIGMVRDGVGQWRLMVSGLTTWWAVPGADGDGSAARKVTTYRVQPTSGQHELYVTTYEVDAGAFATADYSFSVTIFGAP